MIRVINFTQFFNRELMMYSLGDIRFKKPKSVKKVAYTTFFLIIWTIPLFLVFGFPTGPITAVLYLALPLAAGHFASKPVFGGKGLIDFVKTLFNFIGEPKVWTDLKANSELDKNDSYIESEIWIGRRREIRFLNKLEKGMNV